MNQWEEKIWGKTRCLSKTPFHQYHELLLVAGGFCSFHYHRTKKNQFTVHSGSVRIIWAYGWELHWVLLTEGQSFVIAPQVPHQFQVLESGVMVEAYFNDLKTKIEDNDILRLTTGGTVPVERFRNTRAIFSNDGSTWQGNEWRPKP